MKTQDIIAAARTLTVRDIENLISGLMEVRSNMSPPVSEKPPRADGTCDQLVTVEDDPSVSCKRLRDGGIRIWIRSNGIGWLAFNFSARHSAPLRDWLIANTDQNPISDLFGKGVGQGDAH